MDCADRTLKSYRNSLEVDLGQTVQAIVYGVFETKEHRALMLSDEEWLSGCPVMIQIGCGRRRFIGISVAVSNLWTEGDGEVEYPECSASALESALHLQMSKAKRRWAALAKWANSHGVRLGKPELLLVPVERA